MLALYTAIELPFPPPAMAQAEEVFKVRHKWQQTLDDPKQPTDQAAIIADLLRKFDFCWCFAAFT